MRLLERFDDLILPQAPVFFHPVIQDERHPLTGPFLPRAAREEAESQNEGDRRGE
jgi:hypothetical protein